MFGLSPGTAEQPTDRTIERLGGINKRMSNIESRMSNDEGSESESSSFDSSGSCWTIERFWLKNNRTTDQPNYRTLL